ncbi:MAG: DNA primase [Breznakia sp.]
MARISEEIISNIRNQADIVDVISQYMPLHAKGRNFVGICPFHDDHNPSMSVSRDKQIYHCFVCGAGGNVFGFVKNFEQISFVEALKRVADMHNIPLKISNYQHTRTIDENLKPLYSLMTDAIEFCTYELQTLAEGAIKKYLKKRGLVQSIINKFDIGYNPRGDRLYQFLHAKKHRDEDMIRANVVRINEYGAKDVFFHRLMIPIHDSYGYPVGFSARVVDDSSDPKYINTAETEIYHKGHLLFNYHRAKDIAKKTKIIYVVEGAMDVLAFEKAGISNCVATLGTACTDEQIKLLRRLNASVHMFYDGDRAGQEASYKFGLLAKKHRIQIEFITNPSGLDPDEIIHKYGVEELKSVVTSTNSWIEFLFLYLHKKFNLDNYSEKKQFSETMAQKIEEIENEVERNHYYQKLFDLTGFDYHKQVYQPKLKTNGYKKQSAKIMSGVWNAQRQIVAYLLSSKQASEMFRSELGYFPDETFNRLGLIIVDYYRNHDKINLAEIFDFIKGEEVRKILLEIVEWDLAPRTFDVNAMREAIEKIKKNTFSEKINLLLEQSNQMSDPMQKARVANEILKLRRKRGD